MLAELLARNGVAFTLGPTTAFTAIMDEPAASRGRMATLTKVHRGGAPVPSSAAEAWEERCDVPIQSASALTETTFPSHRAGVRDPNKEPGAAYKYPRQVEVIDELPKTSSGKILRCELRDRESAKRKGEETHASLSEA